MKLSAIRVHAFRQFRSGLHVTNLDAGLNIFMALTYPGSRRWPTPFGCLSRASAVPARTMICSRVIVRHHLKSTSTSSTTAVVTS